MLRLVPAEPPRVAAPSMDDAEMLGALQRGDPGGAAALYDRLCPQVRRTIGRLLGGADREEDDLAQISMIEILSSLRRFRGECSLDTWASRITARVVFRELRARSAERSVFDKGALDLDQTEDDANEERRASLRSSLARIREHLGKLDPLKSWTLLLHDVCGYDLKEISFMTDASVAAAQSRLVRGRAELQARLESDPELAEWLQHQRSAT